MLQALGVTTAAETVYREMLRQPDAKVATLAVALAWPREQVAAALDELVELTLVRPSWNDPNTLLVVSPEVGLEWLVARRQAELLRRQHEVEQSLAAARVLMESAKEERSSTRSQQHGVDEFAGLDAVRDGLERIVVHTRHEVLALTPDPAPSAATLLASRQTTQHMLERGVRMRTVYLGSALRQAAAAAHVRWLAEHGAEVRTLPVLPLRLLIFDRTHVVVPRDPNDSTAGATVLRGVGSVALAMALFDEQWTAATGWQGRAAQAIAPVVTDDGTIEARTATAVASTGETAPTAQERALLQLLLHGETDERAARKLGVSIRTVGRMTAELMRRLGAQSRFQAGAFAALHGWVSIRPRS